MVLGYCINIFSINVTTSLVYSLVYDIMMIIIIVLLILLILIPSNSNSNDNNNNKLIRKVVLNNNSQLSYNDEKYFIKENYKSRDDCIHYDDTNNTDEFQNDIYNYALNIIDNNNNNNVITTVADVGCGSGFKLIKFFGDKSKFRTIGLEIEPTLSFLRNKYPDYQWESSDLHSLPPINNIDIVICSDVIEHLPNPDILLNWLSLINFKFLIISTPDREGQSDIMKEISFLNDAEANRLGPPSNTAHIREWGVYEYRMYLQQYFNIIRHVKIAFEANNKIYIETQFIVASNYNNLSCRCNPEKNEYLLLNNNYNNDDNYITIENNLKTFLNELKKPFAICTTNFTYAQNNHHIINNHWNSIIKENDDCIKLYI